MRFTEEEFATMVNELLFSEPVSFDTLCLIAEKTLRPLVAGWCRTEDCLRGRGFEDDLMQDIHLRLIKTTVNSFLLHKGVEGPYNNDPEGFEHWMLRVAKNLKRDFANRVRGRDFKTKAIDDPEFLSAPADDPDREKGIERLKEAIDIALDADFGIYKVLTWLAQIIFILDTGVTKIKSNELILNAFEDKTLYEMYEMLWLAAKRIPWLEITRAQNDRILGALRKKRIGDVSYGETRYSDFFMKSNGKPSGKKSISDWVNRMNGFIKRESNPEDEKPKEKPEQKGPDAQGGNGNEASDS